MGRAWIEDIPPPPPGHNGEHPIVALLAVLAIIVAILLIAWAGVEVHGTGELEAALSEAGAGKAPAHGNARTKKQREVDFPLLRRRLAEGARWSEELIREVAPWVANPPKERS